MDKIRWLRVKKGRNTPLPPEAIVIGVEPSGALKHAVLQRIIENPMGLATWINIPMVTLDD